MPIVYEENNNSVNTNDSSAQTESKSRSTSTTMMAPVYIPTLLLSLLRLLRCLQILPTMRGDKVRHNGAVWENLIDGNVWEPGAIGTEALWEAKEVS